MQTPDSRLTTPDPTRKKTERPVTDGGVAPATGRSLLRLTRAWSCACPDAARGPHAARAQGSPDEPRAPALACADVRLAPSPPPVGAARAGRGERGAPERPAVPPASRPAWRARYGAGDRADAAPPRRRCHRGRSATAAWP